MNRKYKLDCFEWNSQHVRFRVFDTKGANCGTLTVLTEDVFEFVQNSWNGDIVWNGKHIPKPTP